MFVPPKTGTDSTTSPVQCTEPRPENEPLDFPPEGNRKPAKRRAPESEVVERDPQVKRWVLDTAKGTCELCGERSPFHSKAPVQF